MSSQNLQVAWVPELTNIINVIRKKNSIRSIKQKEWEKKDSCELSILFITALGSRNYFTSFYR